ncbi:MAG: heme NO-binding domain-containing protein [Sulfurimonas sp.]|nr:heme NO-binding domain-containing protein [Sulfurimonas sp.]
MKGVVFTEFMEFVENKYGFDAVDAMIEASGLSGVYTQAGNYPFEEMLALVVALSKEVNVEVMDLVEAYGVHLFSILVTLYPHIDKFTSTFDIIAHVDNIIHPEVQKLYPDADLPSFRTLEQSENKIVLQYISKKPLHALAKGLMLGAAAYYKENITVTIDTNKNPTEIEIIKNNG